MLSCDIFTTKMVKISELLNRSYQTFTCSESTIETLGKFATSMMSLLLALNIFHTIFCFCCWLWTGNCLLGLGNYLFKVNNILFWILRTFLPLSTCWQSENNFTYIHFDFHFHFQFHFWSNWPCKGKT